MSVHVMSWVLRNSPATLGQRLVLLVLADKAEHDGTNAWPSVATIAHECRMSERQVQRCLRELEAVGAIKRTGRHAVAGQRHGTYVYAVRMGVELSPFDEAKGDNSVAAEAPKGDIDRAQRVAHMSPDLSVEQPSITATVPEPRTVNRKPVTRDELEVAQSVLAEWNVLTNQQLRSPDWLAKIIMRVREHPELGANEHAAIIRYALAHPWWKGEASPSVVYGNGALFEQHLTQAAKGNVGGSQGAFQIALKTIREARRQA